MPGSHELHHAQPLSLGDASAIAARRSTVALAEDTVELLRQRRQVVVSHVQQRQEPAYGFNRGFGHNVDLRVSSESADLAQAQLNLIRSHAAGIGEAAPPQVVRMTMLLRAQSLARGYSAVRPQLVQTLLDLLNADIVPIVPRHGSVSASGDLAPLAHIARVLIGEGRVLHAGEDKPAASALAAAGIVPLRLEMKEGLALINGCQYLTALGICASDELLTLLKTAVIGSSIAVQVLLGSAEPFREDLHALRPHAGAVRVARWMRLLLHDSPIQRVHRDTAVDGEVQDPYSLRCAAQILGTCHDLVAEARSAFETESNSVTDNPLVLANDHGQHADIVSGGHFHGMPVAVKTYNLVQAAAIVASLCNARCARFVDPARNKGLGNDLMWPTLADRERAASSAFMALEYSSASLTNWIWGHSQPNHLMSITTDCGQEDHVSMGVPLALRLWEILPRLSESIAIELAFCAQAAAIRKVQPYFPSKVGLSPKGLEISEEASSKLSRVASSTARRSVQVAVDVHKRYAWSDAERKLSAPGEAALTAIAAHVPPLTEDRCLSDELQCLAAAVRNGTILAATAKHVQLDEA